MLSVKYVTTDRIDEVTDETPDPGAGYTNASKFASTLSTLMRQREGWQLGDAFFQNSTSFSSAFPPL